MERTILTIGAYERDNFGDLLFLLVFEYICKKRNINLVLGSCIESDMKDYFGKYVFPYHFLLSNYSYDTIWVVGGEIGGCTSQMAVEMSIQNTYLDRYQCMEQSARNLLNEYLTGEKSDHLAYLPNIMKYKKNRNTPFIVNSVGGFESLEQNTDLVVMQNTINVLKNAQAVSVRSIPSFEYLSRQGINAVLVPDSVHALSFFYSPERPIVEEYFLFQVSKFFFDTYGIEIIAKSLYEIIQKYDCQIYLFSAGNANHHDSLEIYEYLKKYIQEKYSEVRIHIVYENNPLKRVNWIAFSKLAIGSSLHVRIIAITYNVPRVGLMLEKLNQYSETWDPVFPYAVVPSILLKECQKALEIDKKNIESIAQNLAVKARDNIEEILNTVYVK